MSFFESKLEVNKREKILLDFLVSSPTISGHQEGGKIATPESIPWIDPILLNEGYSFVKHNFAVVIGSVVTSMWFGLSGKPVSKLLFRRYYPENVGGTLFLETLHKNLVWLTQNIMDQEGPAYKQTAYVYKLHTMFAEPTKSSGKKPEFPPSDLKFPAEYGELIEALKEDLKCVDTSLAPEAYQAWDPPIHFSQLNLALIQFGAIATLFLYPKIAGLREDQGNGLRGYFHIWAVIGRLLGLEDRFNPALFPDRELFSKIFTNTALSNLKRADESVIFLWDYIASKIPLASVKSLLFVALSVVDIEGACLWEKMNWKDKLTYFLTRSLPVAIYKSNMLRVLANCITWGILSFIFWINGIKR